MSKEQEIASIERNLEDSKRVKELGAALERLTMNRDFKAVVNKGYFTDEAVRLVHLKGDPHMQSAESQLSIIKQIDAIANFSLYLNTVAFKANIADKDVAESEAILEELRIEETE